MATHTIHTTKKLSIADLSAFLNDAHAIVALSDEAKQQITACRTYLETKLKTNKEPIYGVNTGFGSLCNVIIPNNELEKLQENLIKSHACGMGKAIHRDIVKLMLFLKVQSLSYGKSGIQLSTVQRLIDLINHQVFPIVYEQGSLGASGDLPLISQTRSVTTLIWPFSLARQAPAVAANGAVGPDHPVAGNEPRDRVAAHRGAHRAHGPRRTNGLGNVLVGGKPAGRNAQQRVPHLHLKVGAAHQQRQRLVASRA